MADLYLLAPHSGQIQIQENARRFTVIPCSRRFGKTELISAVEMPLISPVLFGNLVGIFAPVFKDVAPLWDAVIDRYGELINKADQTKKVIHFVTGGRLDFWSLKDKSAQENGRGRKYHRVIYEETQKIADDVLRHNWQKAIRPTLADYGGEAFFIGTADGRAGYWYELCRRGAAAGKCERNDAGEIDLPAMAGDDGGGPWITFRMITTDNPYIDPAEVEAAADDLDDLTYKQEYYSHFVDYSGAAWCYALTSKEVQNRVFQKGGPVADFRRRLFLSFDFNKIPMTAIAAQRPPLLPAQQNAALGYFEAIHVVKEFKAGERKGEVKTEASIYDTCRLVREYIFAETGRKVGRWTEGGREVVYHNPLDILVTGDASGDAADGRQKVPKTYYDIICEELSLNRRTQLKIPGKNPFHAVSYVQVNTLLQRHPNFKINETAAPFLRRDMLSIKADGRRGIVKAAGAEKQADLLDCLRYFLNTFCK